MSDSLTVLLVDDHAIVRTGLSQLLLRSTAVQSIIEAETGERAYSLFVDYSPDLVIMDLSLPGSGGLHTIRKIVSRAEKARILVFSIHDELVYVTRVMEAGAKGYITKSCSVEMLVDAVNRIARGEIFIEPEVAQRIAVDKFTRNSTAILSELSSREFEVFCLIAKGYTTREAATELCLSIKTVANYSTQIKAKLNTKTTSELTRLAYRYGLFNDRND
ncbi:MAG: response regulator transcription factor [Methylococcaceae bacterium]|nr:response regulator transcription factor [Methylococcaceae bacterium]